MIKIVGREVINDIKCACKNHRFLLLIILSVCVLQIIRLFFGMSYNDESYYFTQVIRFLQGDKPFVDSWDAIQTQGLFLIPFYYVYTLIFKYEGLILFGRFLFFAITVITAMSFYYATRDDFGRRTAGAASLILVVYAPFSLYTVGYNNLLYILGLLGATMFYIGSRHIETEGARAKRCLFASGVIHAAMVASYPTAVIILPFVCIALAYCVYISKEGKLSNVINVMKWYIAGLAFIASVLILYIVCFVGYDNLILCIEKIMDYNDTTHHIDFKGYVDNFIYAFRGYVFSDINMRFGILILCSLSLASLFQTVVEKKRNLLKNHSISYKHISLYAVTFFILYVAYTVFSHNAEGIIEIGIFALNILLSVVILRNKIFNISIIYGIVWLISCIAFALSHLGEEVLDNLTTIDIVTYTACLLPLVLILPVMRNRLKTKWFCIIGAISLLQTLMVAYTGGGFWYQGRNSLLGIVLFVTLMLGVAMDEYFRCAAFNTSLKVMLSRIKIYVVPLIIVAALLLGQYVDVYGDYNELSKLDTRITQGPGKGIYTNEGNATILDEIATDIRKYAIDGGKLLSMETFPYAYGVDPSMKTFTQNTWAATLYTKNSYTTEIYKAPIFDYFEHENDVPDVIFYYNYNSGCFLDNPDPEYRMHQFIIDNYTVAVRKDMYVIFKKND